MSDIQIVADADALAVEAAHRIVTTAQEAIHENGRFSLALSGGSTPERLYRLLAGKPFAEQIDWAKVYVFWGDERCVPPDHPDSNYRMAHEALLAHVPIPAGQIHRIYGEDDPGEAAQAYEKALREFCGDGPPRLDLILLGMGDDGHTASLFPHSAALDAPPDRWVVENLIPTKQVWRVTLTASAINAARQVIFLVSGPEKAERLQQVLHSPYRPHDLPAQLIHPANGKLLWLVDEAAAQAVNS
ncbi:MAG: 6-phosphogluconolactonase [Anaerolineae bacterium]|nr:6-phosphogluconolactonase [Anaerolineae bacterium]